MMHIYQEQIIRMMKSFEYNEETKKEIAAIQAPIHLKILVSLSCTMCPELVTAAQRIAAATPM
mgnify:CR=1 FL=1